MHVCASTSIVLGRRRRGHTRTDPIHPAMYIHSRTTQTKSQDNPQRKMMMMTVIVISYSCYSLLCFHRRNTHAINNNATCHAIWPPNDCVAQHPQIGNAMYTGCVAIVNTTYTLLELSCIIATYNDRKHNLHQSRHAMHDGHLHRS